MKALIYSSVLFLTPALLFAQGLADGTGDSSNPLGAFISTVIEFINSILIPLALAVAFIYLVYGIVKYFVIGGDNDDSKSAGKQMIIYSLVGFVIIFSFYGLVNLFTDFVGFGGDELDDNVVPTVPGVR